jgi:hypothetical protein
LFVEISYDSFSLTATAFSVTKSRFSPDHRWEQMRFAIDAKVDANASSARKGIFILPV